jgi:hypothetical protein
MISLKKGMTGQDVLDLVKDLAGAGYSPTGGDTNVFSNEIAAAVKAFQSEHLGPDDNPLKVDGEVGPLTRWALDVTLGRRKANRLPKQTLPQINSRPANASKSGWNALQLAVAEMKKGAGEKGRDNAGPDVTRYLKPGNGKTGDSWCAAFVSYCFDGGNPGTMPYKYTIGAQDTLKQFEKKGWAYQASVENPPAPGDIIVWWRGKVPGWKGHIGIVSKYSDGIVTTIEGNRGSFPSKVRSFTYVLGRIDKLLGFGHPSP